jgi:hypothetical protein
MIPDVARFGFWWSAGEKQIPPLRCGMTNKKGEGENGFEILAYLDALQANTGVLHCVQDDGVTTLRSGLRSG